MFLTYPNRTNPKLNRTNTCGFVSIKNILVHPTWIWFFLYIFFPYYIQTHTKKFILFFSIYSNTCRKSLEKCCFLFFFFPKDNFLYLSLCYIPNTFPRSVWFVSKHEKVYVIKKKKRIKYFSNYFFSVFRLDIKKENLYTSIVFIFSHFFTFFA